MRLILHFTAPLLDGVDDGLAKTWEPVVLRPIVVPVGIKLDRLHTVLQAAVG